MSQLTCEQLQQLTDAINDRLREFEPDRDRGDHSGPWVFELLSRGVVRLAVDVIMEWQAGNEALWRAEIFRRSPL